MMKNRQDWIDELLKDAEWHTQQAEKLRAAAELLKEDDHPQVGAAEDKRTLTVEMVAKVMGGKKSRKANVAKALGVSLEELDGVMTEANGFSMENYGWWIWSG